jgi:hypothetical protein
LEKLLISDNAMFQHTGVSLTQIGLVGGVCIMPRLLLMLHTRKLALGIVTILPSIYCLTFLVVMLSALVLAWRPPLESFFLLAIFHIVIIFLLVGLAIFYVRHAFTNRALKPEEKTLWITVLLLGNVVAMPIYWWYYIREGDEREKREAGKP